MDKARAGGFDVTTPNVARIYDYVLGGKDNFAADRDAAEQVLAAYPEAREAVQVGRAFLRRTVQYLVQEAGIRQFLDIGTGLPTQQNVHEVAQDAAPDARIVYVDNDPVVCAHGRALLATTPGVAMVQGDLRAPEQILADPATRRLIDFDAPVALLLVSILHFIPDEDDPFGIVARLRDKLAPGSYMAIAHMIESEQRHDDTAKVKRVYTQASSGAFPRTVEQVKRFFDGFELMDHDIFVPRELVERFSDTGWGGVGRKL